MTRTGKMTDDTDNTDDTIDNDPTMFGGAGLLLAKRYRIVRPLGKGGMGNVWLVEDALLDNKPFAIKMLPAALVSNKRACKQLKAEALVAMKLVHPHIVQLRAFEDNDGNPFLVMDYVDGQTLDDYLAEHAGARGALSETDVLRILRPIAAALDYAHAKGVVHRDVKPANVMIAKDGTSYILDFGIAREIQETMTRVTGRLSSGTLLYMSPEQLMGAQPKPEQDVYSFAAMAYECLKGEPPFAHGQIEFQIMNRQPAPLALPNRASHRGIGTLAASVMAGLAKKPELRPKSCARVLSVVQPAMPQRPMVPPVPSLAGKAPRPAANQAAASNGARSSGKGILVACAVVLLSIFIGALWFNRQERRRKYIHAQRQAAMERRLRDEAEKRRVADLREREASLTRQRDEEKRRALEDESRRCEDEKRAKGAATEIRIEAKVLQRKLVRIPDADGFKARKEKLSDVFAQADSLFDEKVGRWCAAAERFTNYVNGCKALIALDGERQSARSNRDRAQAAFRDAEENGAKVLAVTRWNEAVRVWKEASTDFNSMRFASAGVTFASLVKQFEKCKYEANEERRRREVTAKERAEEAAREQRRRAGWHKYGRHFMITEPYGLNLAMRWCPAGTFEMGSPSSEEGRFNVETKHAVTLTKGFWLGETEVTQGQWRRLMGGETIVDLVRKGLQDDTVYTLDGKQQTLREFWKLDRFGDPKDKCGDIQDNIPIYYETWHEAMDFCRRLTEQERAAGLIPDGYEYRLPTEAEWEYACRAGSKTALPNGREFDIYDVRNAPALDEIAWYGGNSSVGFRGRGISTVNWRGKQYLGGNAWVRQVRGKRSNSWGFYDMIGNVREWCRDWTGNYPDTSVTNPLGAATGSYRVYRGGCWRDYARNCRSAYRNWQSPGVRSSDIGFRVALAPSH